LARERLRDMTVRVWDDSGALCVAIAASGLRAEPLAGPEQIAGLAPDRSVVAVAAADRQPLSRLRAANTACLQHGITWLPVGGFDGATVHVGPLMIPGQTACAECLLRRLAANVEYGGVYPEVADAPSAPAPPAVRDWSYSVAALILLRWLAGRDAGLPGLLLSLAPDELAMRQARVYRVPRCPACAGPDFVTAAAPWDIARDH
jgi:bacteriocin biosynthesis cyclodehydratase domain-containing protein